MRSLCTATNSSPHSPRLEKARTATTRQKRNQKKVKVVVFIRYALFPINLKTCRVRKRHNLFPRIPPLPWVQNLGATKSQALAKIQQAPLG